jgi:hypothetical protein
MRNGGFDACIDHTLGSGVLAICEDVRGLAGAVSCARYEQIEAASGRPTKAMPACASCGEETSAPTALQNAAIGAAAIDSYSAACDGTAFLCTQ